jgi:hypothetical protein
MASAMAGRLAAIAVLVLAGGCSASRTTACRCPQPVAYNDAQIEKITAALQALPASNILHETMDDYENERDYLRQCLGQN